MQINKPAFVTGYGQSDTRALTLSDGKPNPHPSAGQPYATLSGADIAKLVKHPPSVPKDQAQWFIPSSYVQHDARTHEAQRAQGQFHFLTLDVDVNNLDRETIATALDIVCGKCCWMIYSTKSASPDNRKWRALVPLRNPLAGADYPDTANAFFDLLENATQGDLIPDRALARPAQLIYLPNAGAHYDWQMVQGNRLDLGPLHQITRHRDATRAARAKAEQEAQAIRERRMDERKAKVQAGDVSPVDHFNAAHSIADLLGRYGYVQAGSSNDWKSPFQSSGSYATRDCGEFWISLSASDAAQEIGAATKDGHRHGDAFDLFRHFEHGGDFKAAVRAYALEAGLNRQDRETPATGQHSASQAQDDGPPATAGQHDRKKPEVAFQFVPVADLKYRAPEYIIGELIETDTLGLMFGDPGCGKSFLAVDIALSVATGTPFHGRDTKQGSVFFIAGEGHNGLARRFAAWSVARGVSLSGVPLFKSERAAQFLDGTSAKAVADAVAELAALYGSPALIIIDTLARNFGAGDENNTSDMSEFVVAVDDLKARFPGCSVLIVHHSGHAEKQRARGAMALKGALDCEYRVEKEGHAMKLVNTKMKDAEPPQDVYFNFRQVDLDGIAKSAVLDATEPPERQHKLTPTQRLAQETYVTAAAQNGIWDDGGFRGVHLDQWRDHFYSKHTGDSAEAKRKAFQRVRRDLVDAGQMTATHDVFLIRDAGLQMAILLQRDKRDIAGQNEKCPGAEAGLAGTCGTNA